LILQTMQGCSQPEPHQADCGTPVPAATGGVTNTYKHTCTCTCHQRSSQRCLLPAAAAAADAASCFCVHDSTACPIRWERRRAKSGMLVLVAVQETIQGFSQPDPHKADRDQHLLQQRSPCNAAARSRLPGDRADPHALTQTRPSSRKSTLAQTLWHHTHHAITAAMRNDGCPGGSVPALCRA